ncbi:hypothetical protein ABZ353_36460 [Streptomyces niveus]|uniref:hypothetical protein n=1 Tax=Streptomyces niveus TaxID=193462 RepID=UPI003410EBA7
MAEDKDNKVSMWLGATASALALLAFFGVANWDELVAKVDPESASRESCTDAWAARKSFSEISGLGQSWRVYGQRLPAVAEKTDDVRFKTLFSSDGEASVETADAVDRLEFLKSDAPARAKEASNAWRIVCTELFNDEA